MRLRSGAAYAERPPPPLPHDALCRIFSFLPRGALAVTPGRVCRAWAAAKAQVWALLPPASYDEQVHPFLPLWYARSVFDNAPWRRVFDRVKLGQNKQRMVSGAARHGQVEALQYFYAADRGVFKDTNASHFAAQGGQLGVLHWLRQHGGPLHWEVCCLAAARRGHLPVVQYCREQGCEWDKDMCKCAAEGGQLSVLMWLRENGCPWDGDTCREAALGGHLSVLQYCRAQGCPWNKRTCEAAAQGGHLSVLQYCREHGCPWGKWTCWWAAHRGHLSVLQWCVAQGCPISVETCIVASPNPACRAWLKTLRRAAQQE